MRSSDEIEIDGDLETVYRLGAEIEHWPDLLPHYRGVDILWRDGNDVVARMKASRDGIPVSWVCRQQRDPETPKITFQHIDGFTRGMRAVWTFERRGERMVVARITHEFRKGWPVFDRWVTETVVGDFFTHNIAGKTLAMVKLLAESERAAHELANVTEHAGEGA